MAENGTDKKTANTVSKDRGLMRPNVFILIICGTALNFILSYLVKQTGLPFYIDNVGSIIATALGGIVPGIYRRVLLRHVPGRVNGDVICVDPAAGRRIVAEGAIISVAFGGHSGSPCICN